jgi:hypothetical protein
LAWVAAALSGDENMIADYRSGDPYLAFGIGAGLLPVGATKDTHGVERDAIKSCVLGMLYGMQEYTLASRIGKPVVFARKLMRAHQERYGQFWKWSDAVVACVMQGQTIRTVFGWPLRPSPLTKERSVMNWPMQAHGSEMLRLACCLGTERGIEVCAPVHDAVLIGAPIERIEADVAGMQEAMAEASRAVLGGFTIPTEAKIVRYPDRFMDEKRGRAMWDRVMKLNAKGNVMEDFDINKWRIPEGSLPPIPAQETANRATKDDPLMGAPLSWWLRVLPHVNTRGQLVVAIYLWRRRKVCRSATFNVPNGELAKLGITHKVKKRALKLLAAAGVIEIAPRRSAKDAPTVTIK